MRKIKKKDIERLEWIHSNRVTSASSFKKRFFPEYTDQGVHRILKYYVQNKLLLSIEPQSRKYPWFWSLSEEGIKVLVDKKVYLGTHTRPIKIGYGEPEHHSNVVDLRVAFETNPDLEPWEYSGAGDTFSGKVFFVTDYELNKGIKPRDKWNYLIETPDDQKEAFFQNWKNELKLKNQKTLQEIAAGQEKKRIKSRRPDGFFWALWEGKKRPFVLEYEHAIYTPSHLEEVIKILKIEYSYTTEYRDGTTEKAPIKLFICRSPARVENLKKQILGLLKDEEPENLWMISDLETVKTLPIKTAFQVVI